MDGARPAMTNKKSLQRLDLDLTEFHHALVVLHAGRVLVAESVLQPDVAFGVLSVFVFDGLLSVQHYGERVALRGDLVDIPLADRLRHRIDLGDADNRTGRII